MNRAFYIVGIVFSVVFMFITAYYAEETQSARWADWDYNYSSYDPYDSYPSYSSYSYDSSNDVTVEAGLWSLFFFLAFLAIDILGLAKVKTKTMKVFGILGLCFTGIFLLWDAVMLSGPGGVSFDEVAPAWILYCFLMLAFTIVGLVQSVRYHKQLRQGMTPENITAAPTSGARDLLDD